MGLWLTVVRVAVVFNVAVLAGLSVIWARNYRSVPSKHTLGLLVFGLLLLLENALAIWFFAMDPSLSKWFASEMTGPPGDAMMALRVAESAALVFLAWVTLD